MSFSYCCRASPASPTTPPATAPPSRCRPSLASAPTGTSLYAYTDDKPCRRRNRAYLYRHPPCPRHRRDQHLRPRRPPHQDRRRQRHRHDLGVLVRWYSPPPALNDRHLPTFEKRIQLRIVLCLLMECWSRESVRWVLQGGVTCWICDLIRERPDYVKAQIAQAVHRGADRRDRGARRAPARAADRGRGAARGAEPGLEGDGRKAAGAGARDADRGDARARRPHRRARREAPTRSRHGSTS